LANKSNLGGNLFIKAFFRREYLRGCFCEIEFDYLDGDFFDTGSSANIHRTIFTHCSDMAGAFRNWVANFMLSATFVGRFGYKYLFHDPVLVVDTGSVFAGVGLLGDV